MACRCGTEYTEDNVIRAFGYSAICDPMGTILARANLGETVIKAEIDEEFKKKCSTITLYFRQKAGDLQEDPGLLIPGEI